MKRASLRDSRFDVGEYECESQGATAKRSANRTFAAFSQQMRPQRAKHCAKKAARPSLKFYRLLLRRREHARGDGPFIISAKDSIKTRTTTVTPSNALHALQPAQQRRCAAGVAPDNAGSFPARRTMQRRNDLRHGVMRDGAELSD
jgi:hypothetical protein